MKFARRIFFILFALLAIWGGLSVLQIFWHSKSPERKNLPGPGIFLTRPAFAQVDGMSFLEEEAGIAAYTNLEQKVNLTTAKTAFRTIEKETRDYIIGSVPVPGYEDKDIFDVHCFIHVDGWVVAYYSRDASTSKIMYWHNWDGKTISTKVEEGLNSAASTIGLASTEVKYYHFKYPDANKLMIIANKGGNSFKITIPSELVVHERSYSITDNYNFFVDSQEIGKGSGLITFSQLKPDVAHWVSGGSSQYGGNHATVLVYQEN